MRLAAAVLFLDKWSLDDTALLRWRDAAAWEKSTVLKI
jgi:hypothetical protein